MDTFLFFTGLICFFNASVAFLGVDKWIELLLGFFFKEKGIDIYWNHEFLKTYLLILVPSKDGILWVFALFQPLKAGTDAKIDLFSTTFFKKWCWTVLLYSKHIHKLRRTVVKCLLQDNC